MTKQRQPAHVHKASKLVQDKMDEATVRRKTVVIVDELAQNKDFKVLELCIHSIPPKAIIMGNRGKYSV